MSLTSYRAAPPRGVRVCVWGIGGPGGDLLFRALRRSTIGAEGFHGRVRNGIGLFAPRYGHQAGQTASSFVEAVWENSEYVTLPSVSSLDCRAAPYRHLPLGTIPKCDI